MVICRWANALLTDTCGLWRGAMRVYNISTPSNGRSENAGLLSLSFPLCPVNCPKTLK